MNYISMRMSTPETRGYNIWTDEEIMRFLNSLEYPEEDYNNPEMNAGFYKCKRLAIEKFNILTYKGFKDATLAQGI